MKKTNPLLKLGRLEVVETEVYCGEAYVVFAPADPTTAPPELRTLIYPVYFHADPTTLSADAYLERNRKLVKLHPSQIDLSEASVGADTLCRLICDQYDSCRAFVRPQIKDGYCKLRVLVNGPKTPASMQMLMVEEAFRHARWAMPEIAANSNPDDPALVVEEAESGFRCRLKYMLVREVLAQELGSYDLSSWCDEYPPGVDLFRDIIDFTGIVTAGSSQIPSA